MTIGVIYQIAADITKMESGVQKGAAALGRLESAAMKAGALLTGIFTVNAAAQFASAILEDADALTRMSDQTGVGVEALQRLRAIGADAGNSIEELTSAINMMQKRLAGGDASAVGALNQLGLSWASFINLSPDEQFMAIARAVAQIESPMERVKIATDLFGKSGAAVLPSLRADVDAITEATSVMSAQSVKFWDDVGDAIGRAKQRLQNFVASILAAPDPREKFAFVDESDIAMIDRLAGNTGNLAHETTAAGEAARLYALHIGSLPVGPTLTLPGLPAPDVMKESDDLLKKLTVKAEAWQAKLDAVREKAAALNTTLVNHTTQLRASDLGTRQFTQALLHEDPAIYNLDVRLQRLTSTVQAWDQALPGVEGAVRDYAAEQERATKAVQLFNNSATVMPGRIRTAAEAYRASGGIVQRVNGYLNDVEGILGGIQTKWAQMATVAVRGIQSIAKNLSEGDWLGAAVAGVSAFGEAIAGAFRDEEWEKVNDLRDDLQSTFGTFDDMALAAQRAGYSIERLLDTKKVDDFNREMAALTEAIRFQDDTMQFLDETVKKYGFTIEELGPAFARQRLDEQAQQLFKEFTALTAAGIDTGVVLEHMGSEINAFVQSALRTGTEIPAAMAPMIQRMVEMGILTDENGNIITDLEKAGVKFAMTMSEGFERLIGEVQRLTDAIARGLGLAIDNVPPLHVPVTIDDPSANVVSQEQDGSGMANRPLFFAEDAGPAAFAFSRGGQRFSDSGSGGDGRVEQLLERLSHYLEHQLYRDVSKATVWARQTG